MGTCRWCGDTIPDKNRKCAKCKQLHREYTHSIATANRSCSTTWLIELRNMLHDMKFNMPNAKNLPFDLDYQYDRINRYLSER